MGFQKINLECVLRKHPLLTRFYNVTIVRLNINKLVNNYIQQKDVPNIQELAQMTRTLTTTSCQVTGGEGPVQKFSANWQQALAFSALAASTMTTFHIICTEVMRL